MTATLPNSGTLTSVGSFDVPGRGKRTLYAWGIFAGGRLIVQAVVPHAAGDEVFDVADAAPKTVQDVPDDLTPDAVDTDPPVPLLELSDRGFITFDLAAPILRVSLIECDDTPRVNYWIG